MKRGILFFIIVVWVCSVKAQTEYELNAIVFNGNNFFSSSVLKEIILSEESPPWYWKFLNSFTSLGKPAQFFDSSLIKTDLRALQNFYNDKGFFRAEFSYTYELDSISKKAILRYDIRENDAAQYGSLKLLFKKNIPIHLQDKLYLDFDIDSSYRYDQEFIEKQIGRSIETLTNNGYMTAGYDSTIIFRDTITRRANLNIFIDPGDRLTIGEIRINKSGEGSPYVSDTLLKEVAAIRPGEFYSREKVGKSQLRLFRTGLFRSINLSGAISDTAEGKIPLDLSGNIGYLNELAPEIIMDNERSSFNLGLGAAYTRRNFLGDARKFTFSTKAGIIDVMNFNFDNIFRKPADRDSTFQGFVNFSAKVEQPYIFNRPIYGNLEFYANLLTILRSTSNTLGSKILFDFEMPYYTFVSLLQPSYSLEFLEYIPSLENLGLDLKIHSLTSILGTEIGSSRTDDIFFPASGYNSTFLIEGAVSNTKYLVSGIAVDTIDIQNPNVGETAYFYKAQLTNAFYFPLNFRKTLVFAAKLKTGYIQNIKGSQALIPPNRTFFAGGSNSVRGWRSREIAPEDTVEYYGLLLNSSSGNSFLGGTFLLEGSFEYRIRFLRDFGLTFFSDYGSVFNGYQKFRFDKFAVAAGFGLRYFSSIAPFRFDFGWKFYDPKDKGLLFNKAFFKQLEFHFGIGEAF
jgi:outer membrane protein insertion porin family